MNAKISYIINLVLFVLLFIILGLWFIWHVQPWFYQSSYVTLVIALWGLWKIVQSFFYDKDSFEKVSRQLTKRLFANKTLTEVLVFVLILVLPLNFITASLYFEFTPNDLGESHLDVEVYHQGSLIFNKFEISALNPIDGIICFPYWGEKQLKIKITGNNYYAPQDLLLKQGDNVKRMVPTPEVIRSFNLLRIVFGSGYINLLLEKPTSASNTFSLDIYKNKKLWITIDSLLLQQIYLGASLDEIDWTLANMDKSILRETLTRYLRHIQIHSEQAKYWIDTWERNERIDSTSYLKQLDTLRFVVKHGSQGRVLTDTSYVYQGQEIETIFIER